MSRANRKYEIRIYGMPQARTLTGGVSPIVIDEDSSDNFFEAVRTQTGEIKFWDSTGDLWQSIAPTLAGQRKVKLYHIVGNTSTLVWQGYISPETYSGGFVPMKGTNTLTCYCPLSLAEGQYLDYDLYGDDGYHEDSYYGRTAPSMAWYLLKILTACGGDWNNFYFQCGDLMEWMNVRINYEIFFDENQNAKYNNLELLRHICTFFGWQCHMHGGDLYFVSPTDNTTDIYPITGLQELMDLAKFNTNPQSQPISLTLIDLDDYTGYFASTQQTQLIVPGLSRCTITGDVDPVENFIDYPTKAIEDVARSIPGEGGAHLGDGWFYFKNITQTIPTSFWGDVTILNVLYNPWGSIHGGPIEIRDISQNNEHSTPPKRNYNWEGPFLRIPYSRSTATYLFSARQGLTFSAGGILVISASIWEDEFTASDHHNVYPATGNLYVRLCVGGKYWNGSAWITPAAGVEPPKFAIPTGSEDGSTSGKGKILNTRLLADPYPSFDGYGIPVSANMGGNMDLWIYGDEVTGGSSIADTNNTGLRMSGLSIKYYENNSSPLYTEEDSNVHEVANNTAFTQEAEFDIPFTAWDDNKYGRGILLLGNGGYCDKLHYGQNSENPEEHFASHVATFGNTARRQIELEFAMSVLPDITPVTCIFASRDYYPFYKTWDWYDDLVKITAIEL